MSQNNSNVAGEFVIKGKVDTTGIDSGMQSAQAKVDAGAAKVEQAANTATNKGVAHQIKGATKPFTEMIGLVGGLVARFTSLGLLITGLVSLFDTLTAKVESANEKLRKLQNEGIAGVRKEIAGLNPLGGLDRALLGGDNADLSEVQRKKLEQERSFGEAANTIRAKFAEEAAKIAEKINKGEVSNEGGNEALRQLEQDQQDQLDVLHETATRRRAELEIAVNKDKNAAISKAEYDLADDRRKAELDQINRVEEYRLKYGYEGLSKYAELAIAIRDKTLREIQKREDDAAKEAADKHKRYLEERAAEDKKYADALKAITDGIAEGFAKYGGAENLDASIQNLTAVVQQIARKDFAIGSGD